MEMINLLAAEFAPGKAVQSFAASLKGAAGTDRAAQNVFGEYGRGLAGRTVELGEKYVERTYEILKEAAKKTGRLAFPHIPQRFVEIGYLATQPMEYLNILMNNHYGLAFRVDQCATFDALAETCGAEVAGEMPCRYACTAFLEEIFRILKMNVSVEAEALHSPAGFCRFRCSNRDAL
jgi:hypothetical protein